MRQRTTSRMMSDTCVMLWHGWHRIAMSGGVLLTSGTTLTANGNVRAHRRREGWCRLRPAPRRSPGIHLCVLAPCIVFTLGPCTLLEDSIVCTVLYCATLSSISSRSKFESDDEWKHDTGCAGRTQQVWDVLFKTVAAEDPSSHLTSLHNDKYLYNLSQPWLTHYSIQHVHNRPADLWRIFGRKPFVWDEVKYEGDVPKNWGSLRPGQMVDKFWWGAACGAYSGTL